MQARQTACSQANVPERDQEPTDQIIELIGQVRAARVRLAELLSRMRIQHEEVEQRSHKFLTRAGTLLDQSAVRRAPKNFRRPRS
jgi:hypothetical protein